MLLASFTMGIVQGFMIRIISRMRNRAANIFPLKLKAEVKGVLPDFKARLTVILFENLYSCGVSIGKLCMSCSRYAVQSQVY